MSAGGVAGGPPRRVLVVGAGIVGLSCAWSLREHGVEVRVVERAYPGAGASWQNAGFVSPALTVPLPEPAVLRYGVRAVLSPSSPVRVLAERDPHLLGFLAGLVRHCTAPAWRRAMSAYKPLNEQAVEAFERQLAGGVDAELLSGDVLACFRGREASAGLMHELEGVVAGGQQVRVELLSGDDARSYEPKLSGEVAFAVKVLGQRYLTPSSFVLALAASVRQRGAEIRDGTTIDAVERRAGALVARGPSAELEADAVVIACGAWMSPLARQHGVRVPVYGGRGYSFTLPCVEPLRGPTYFPAQRVAVTPQGERVRLAGIMEFGSPDAPPRPRRFETMVRSMRPMLDGVDWSGRQDDWMGPRPLTTDGLPLVGETRTPGVFVAGGHGMWGVTLGPLTGALLARRIATGVTPPELRPLDPCR